MSVKAKGWVVHWCRRQEAFPPFHYILPKKKKNERTVDKMPKRTHTLFFRVWQTVSHEHLHRDTRMSEVRRQALPTPPEPQLEA